jgi:DNA-binding winged helix-turn-helix (wHTH) protein/tetratricopeptide (TPR) repeat protein/TolB-like protein
MLMRFAGFELDQARGELRGSDGEVLKLRPKTFAMLELFADNAGRLLSKEELMAAVWPDVHVAEDSLFKCIRELRTVLGDDKRQLIKLMSGRGYLFESAVVREQGDGAGPVAVPASAPGVVASYRPGSNETDPATPQATTGMPRKARVPFRTAVIGLVGLCTVVGLTVAATELRRHLLSPARPTIAVSIVDSGNDSQAGSMASNVTADVAEGLSKISTIRMLSAPPSASTSGKTVSFAPAATPDIFVEGRLQKDDKAWSLQARATNTATGEVRWSTVVSVATENADETLQRARLVGGLGHSLAQYVNTLVYPGERQGRAAVQTQARRANAKIVVEQATAYINQTSRERFAAAQGMLENALAKDPDNIDLESALAAHLLRGIQTVWYSPADSEAAERKARSLLERALQTEPQYLPVLENYCRFQTATNHFVESLVACANALTFDPWNGLVRFNLGLAQDQLGRFSEALATFKEADRFDTPAVSRWTWLLGVGMTYMLMDRDEEAVPWLQRSLAITPGTGRTQMLLAGAYQRLGRVDEAKAAMAEALKQRPGSNLENSWLPRKNTSPLWLAAGEKIARAEVEAGLPEH